MYITYCIVLLNPTLNIFFILNFTICIIFRRYFVSLLKSLFFFSLNGVYHENGNNMELSRVKLYSYMIVIIFFVLFLILLKAKSHFYIEDRSWREMGSPLHSRCVCLERAWARSLLFFYYYFTDDFHIKSHTTIFTTTTWTTYKTLNEWITLFLCLLFICVSVCVCAVVVPSSFRKK